MWQGIKCCNQQYKMRRMTVAEWPVNDHLSQAVTSHHSEVEERVFSVNVQCTLRISFQERMVFNIFWKLCLAGYTDDK